MTRLRGWRQRASSGQVRAGDDGVALLMVLIIMVMVMSLGLLVTALAVQQTRPTAFTRTSSRSLSAAEAGLQVGLGQLRSVATTDATGKTIGDPSRLPCALSGPVGAPTDPLSYRVAIAYYSVNPTGASATWVAAHTLMCVDGSGLAHTPAYALMTSTGTTTGLTGTTTAAGDRVLTTLYKFKASNAHVVGGLIWNRGRSYCLKAADAAAGSTISYIAAAACTAEDPLQGWAYTTDYHIKLTSTITATDPGLCVTGLYSSNGPATLTACATTRYDQLFSYESYSRFRGQTTSNTYSDNCLWAGVQSSVLDGRLLMSGGSTTAACAGQYTAWDGYTPDPSVGAGAAGPATDQWVNYMEFGRCLDLLNKSIWETLIIYPCKQDPSGTSTTVTWNQLWYYDTSSYGTPRLYTRYQSDDTKRYCPLTPTTISGHNSITVTTCSSTQSRQQWTYSGNTGNYASSYVFTDIYGRCLSSSRQPGDTIDATASEAVVAPCTGGSEQKWNAPSDAGSTAVTNTRESSRS